VPVIPKTASHPAKRKPDARIRRTREILGDALVKLIQEKPFDSITVQQVLDRAGVSRSTFYTHYSDKNDLFFSDAEEFFEAASTALSRKKERSNRVAPVREFFAHVAEARQFHAALVSSGKMQALLELGQEHFARGIEQRLREIAGVRAIANTQRALLAHAFSGAMMSLMSWWLHHTEELSAAEMDRYFHQMVWSGIGGLASEKPEASSRTSTRWQATT
jgi:AcrR family transcriptional regulator